VKWLINAKLEVRQVLGLAFREGVEHLHLEILVIPGDVDLADAEGPKIQRRDAVLIVNRRPRLALRIA
jgi:hypothetical protein